MISKADLVCPGFAADTLGSHPELEALKHKVEQHMCCDRSPEHYTILLALPVPIVIAQ